MQSLCFRVVEARIGGEYCNRGYLRLKICMSKVMNTSSRHTLKHTSTTEVYFELLVSVTHFLNL